MVSINISSNIKEFTKGLNYLYKNQVPYAISRTINDIVDKGKTEVQNQIPNMFDNKKVWWKNKDTGILRNKSNKYLLKGEVYVGSKNYFASIQQEGGIKQPEHNKNLSIPFKDNVPRSRQKSGSARKYLNQKNVFIANNIILQRKYRKKAIPLFRLTKRAVIKPRFKFYEICNGVLNSNIENSFYKYLEHAIKTAKNVK